MTYEPRALVTGGTGFVGRALLELLGDPVVLSRDPTRARQTLARPEAAVHAWDWHEGRPPVEALEGVTAVFHLAGESIADRRWSPRVKEEILASRRDSTRLLVDTLLDVDPRPRVLVSASAIGLYGDRGDEVLDESASPGTGFLAEVCEAWEAEARRAEEGGVRVVMLRIGLVLGPGGGALAPLLRLFRLGLGGRLGHGRQWMSWIHVRDLVALAIHAANDADLAGPVNATSPEAVTNREFTRRLAGILRRPAIFPAPRPMLRLVLGEFAEWIVASQRVTPTRAIETGFGFELGELTAALEASIPRR